MIVDLKVCFYSRQILVSNTCSRFQILCCALFGVDPFVQRSANLPKYYSRDRNRCVSEAMATRCRTAEGKTDDVDQAFASAAAGGKVEEVTKLLEQKANVNCFVSNRVSAR